MSEEPLVSVIVPVYNVRPYLRECVESIVAQTYGNLEIIVVDDGSTDGSGELCDELDAMDSRITVVHKKNGGLSDARNCGLHNAHGEWISFVDSDDWLSPVFIEVLVVAALDCGCSIAAVPSIKPFIDGETCEVARAINEVPQAKVLSSEETQRLMLYQAMDTAAPTRLYARDVLGDNPFPRGIFYEDLASVYKFIHQVDRVAVVDAGDLYAYRQRSDSIIRQEYRHIKAVSALIVADQLYRDICEWYPQLAAAAASRCFSVCRMVFAQVPMGDTSTAETERDRQALWEVIARHKNTVLHDKHARRRERLAAVFACMGEGPFFAFCSFCRSVGKMK